MEMTTSLTGMQSLTINVTNDPTKPQDDTYVIGEFRISDDQRTLDGVMIQSPHDAFYIPSGIFEAVVDAMILIFNQETTNA